MNKKISVIGITALALLMAVGTVTPVFAATADHALARLGKGAWTSATDNFGFVYTFTHTKGSKPYAFTGYLIVAGSTPDLPWPLAGKQARANGFTFTVTNPNPSNGYCTFTFTGMFTSATSASGTWTNVCGVSGSFTMSPGGGGIAVTGGAPDLP